MEEDENKKHIKEIYKEKAIKLLKIFIIISILSGISYVFGILIYKSFDFGLIFEIISFVFIVFAINNIKQSNFKLGKKDIIIASIPIVWLIIYDFINLIAHINEVLIEVAKYYMSLDEYFYYLEPYLFDVTLVINVILLYKTYKSLNIADGTEKGENYIENFYDKL